MSALPTIPLALPEEVVDAIAVRVAELLEERAPVRSGPEPWVGVERAAAHLAAQPHRVYDLVATGRLPHRKDGRRLLFKLSELDGWLDDEGRS